MGTAPPTIFSIAPRHDRLRRFQLVNMSFTSTGLLYCSHTQTHSYNAHIVSRNFGFLIRIDSVSPFSPAYAPSTRPMVFVVGRTHFHTVIRTDCVWSVAFLSWNLLFFPLVKLWDFHVINTLVNNAYGNVYDATNGPKIDRCRNFDGHKVCVTNKNSITYKSVWTFGKSTSCGVTISVRHVRHPRLDTVRFLNRNGADVDADVYIRHEPNKSFVYLFLIIRPNFRVWSNCLNCC